MTQLEECKKVIGQICMRQNDCWHDTKTIATAVYVILTHMIDADRKTEPASSKMEQVDKDINVRSKDEPQTEVDWKQRLCDMYGANRKSFDEAWEKYEADKVTDEPQTERSSE